MTSITRYSFKLDTCPECNGSIILVKEKGETVCCQCGLIIYERQIDLPYNDRRIYNNEDSIKKERLGTPISPLPLDIELCTYIDKNIIYNPELNRAVRRDTNLAWKSRNLLITTKELKRIGHNLNLPSYILEEALNLYKRAIRTNMLKGRSTIGMIIACIYYSCKSRGIPRTLQEILKESPIIEKKVKKCYKALVDELNLKVCHINPTSFVPKYAAALNLNFDVEKVACKILQLIYKKNLIRGNDPKGFCAGALYFASKIKKVYISQKEIAKIVGITEVTLRSRYKELLKNIKLITYN
jgi:transcription initiation factor TFIIB